MPIAVRSAAALAILIAGALLAPAPSAAAPAFKKEETAALFRLCIEKNNEARTKVANVQYRLRENRAGNPAENTVTKTGEVVSYLGNAFSDLLVTSQLATSDHGARKERVVYLANPEYKAETTYAKATDGTFAPKACVVAPSVGQPDANRDDITLYAFEVVPHKSIADFYRPDDPSYRYEAERDDSHGTIKLRIFRSSPQACQPLQDVTVSTRQGYLITESTERYTCGKVGRKWIVEPKEVAPGVWFPNKAIYMSFEEPKAPGQFGAPLLQGTAVTDNVRLLLSFPEENFKLDSLKLPKDLITTVRQPNWPGLSVTASNLGGGK